MSDDKNKKQNPLWIAIAGVIVVPLIAIAVNNWEKFSPSPAPDLTSPHYFQLIGVAYNRDGSKPITNTPIRIIDISSASSATQSDGSFVFKNLTENDLSNSIRLSVQTKNTGQWISKICKTTINPNNSEIDLGSVYFPIDLEAAEDLSENIPDGKEQLRNRQSLKLPAPPLPKRPSKTERYEVTLKLPTGIGSHELSISPEEGVTTLKKGATYYLFSVAEGHYDLLLRNETGSWSVRFSNRDHFVSSDRFDFAKKLNQTQ